MLVQPSDEKAGEFSGLLLFLIDAIDIFMYNQIIKFIRIHHDENKKKQQTSVLVNVGNVDGCNVKFYDNGVSKFYLARCGNVETRTEEVRRGKFTELVTTIIKND